MPRKPVPMPLVRPCRRPPRQASTVSSLHTFARAQFLTKGLSPRSGTGQMGGRCKMSVVRASIVHACSCRLSGQARFPEDGGAGGRHRRGAFERPSLRRPETRCDAAALRPAARARRRLQVLGGHEGAFARSGGKAPGRRGGGSPARLRRFRRHDPQGPIRRRDRATVGPRHLDARGRQEPAGGAGRRGSEVRAARQAPARQLRPGPHEARPQRRQADELVADQTSRRRRPRGRWCRRAGERSFGRLRPCHGGDRRRQRQGAGAFHARQGQCASLRCGLGQHQGAGPGAEGRRRDGVRETRQGLRRAGGQAVHQGRPPSRPPSRPQRRPPSRRPSRPPRRP